MNEFMEDFCGSTYWVLFYYLFIIIKIVRFSDAMKN
jgi:hypothetical protein